MNVYDDDNHRLEFGCVDSLVRFSFVPVLILDLAVLRACQGPHGLNRHACLECAEGESTQLSRTPEYSAIPYADLRSNFGMNGYQSLAYSILIAVKAGYGTAQDIPREKGQRSEGTA